MKPAKWCWAASVMGAAHAKQNTLCQDRFASRRIETAEAEIFIAAVADGGGSTLNGQIGAEIACEFFVEQTAQLLQSANAAVTSLNEEFGRRWICYLQDKISSTAVAAEKPLREFASTFVGAVVGAGGAAFYQIGDGAIVYSVSGAPGTYRFGVEPAETEYVNMTDFVTDAAAAERLRSRFVEEVIEDLILFSDGIFAVAVDYQTSAPLRAGRELEGLNRKLERFLASPKIDEKTDDDKTIILASRAGQ